MSKLTITLDPDTHDTLAARAKADDRSLTNYIQVLLKKIAKSDYDINSDRPTSPYKKTIIG